MREYKYIFLVIYSLNNSVYDKMYNHILNYSNTFDDSILTMFLVGDHTIKSEYEYDPNTKIFRVRVFESLKNIYYKTINAIGYCLENYKFSYLIRTNISSFWNYYKLDLLDSLCSNPNSIYGYKVKIGGIEFITGYCIIMPYNTCYILYNNRTRKNTNDNDDINISNICKMCGIELTHIGIVHPFTRECSMPYARKIINRFNSNNNNVMLYRVRSRDRENFDLNIFGILNEIIYTRN
jgi:hypothetical protein